MINTTALFASAIESLRAQGIAFDSGLSDEEFAQIESAYAFRFPPDLREFLSLALPVAEGFIQWRTQHTAEIALQMQLPVRKILSNIAYRDFWLESWGLRPCEPGMAREVALSHLTTQPKLIPIYQGYYLPEEPHQAGNPVLSFHQFNISFAGEHIPDFLEKVFNITLPYQGQYQKQTAHHVWIQLAQ